MHTTRYSISYIIISLLSRNTRFCAWMSVSLTVLGTALADPALPETEPQTVRKAASSEKPPAPEQISVTGHLNRERARIFPGLGAVDYTIDQHQITTTPGGQNAAFNQILLRVPGVVLDSYGEVHVRGEHGGLTYRVNGVLLPEGLNGFGQELDTRIIQSVDLLTGTLPAQFGFRTAGVVDVTTKTGDSLKHNQVSLYGGSYNTFVPSVQLGGQRGKLDYFTTLSFTRNNIGIENPSDTFRAIHDVTEQEKAFSYLSWHLDEASRLTLLTSASYADFEIPNSFKTFDTNSPDYTTLYDVAGVNPHDPAMNWASLNDSQTEQNYYAVLSYQRTTDRLNLQVSPYFRYGRIDYTPDRDRDLIYQGVSEHEVNDFTTGGMQADLSYEIARHHTLRAGLLGQYTSERLDTDTLAFPVDEAGNQSANTPVRLMDNTGNWSVEAGAYIQDEYRITRSLTFNYGIRYDRFASSFDNEGQLSPRANMVWKPTRSTTLHLGYSRYFAPPSPQYVYPSTLARFVGTTNAAANTIDSATKVEKSHYVDGGILQRITPDFQITLDAYAKWAHDLTDLGQFGRAVILAPFSYRRGRVYGAEFGSSWRHGPWSLFGNFSYVKTSARDINSAQYQFDPAVLAYIRNHAIQLDHQGEFTATAGASWTTKHDMAYADFVYGYGLRSGFANLEKEPQYDVFNIGYQHTFTKAPFGHDIKVRADVVNLFDKRYQLRDGSGVGIYQAQYGQRRGTFFAVVSEF
ncbi:Putative outer membrane receptor for iron transport [Gluconobacter oxydans 621H]|uniref:Putative outer membrane receptor for iron transport n=2 Tax=Gluconobacter oxydans TaxID=442 RepID=Q5FTH3_GLUOX|nr:Putative outer membrane receptor for iron transport [Gluconobacter oxydans 621H]TCW28802.1 outer membrane receptor protein involved in Fe transport [Gluconobacter oxydans]